MTGFLELNASRDRSMAVCFFRRSQACVKNVSSYASCLIAFVVAGVFLTTACVRGPQRKTLALAANDWHEFQGTWTAAGSRSTIMLEGSRRASISNLTGSLLLAGPSRPAVGFRAEAVVFTDSLTGMVGRAVWTDEHGDQAFSELRGFGSRTENTILGTFVGGTGRYSGATGDYEFSWRFLLESDEGMVQGQSLGLIGRVRVDSEGSAPKPGER
jgi:hypothetical protein